MEHGIGEDAAKEGEGTEAESDVEDGKAEGYADGEGSVLRIFGGSGDHEM